VTTVGDDAVRCDELLAPEHAANTTGQPTATATAGQHGDQLGRVEPELVQQAGVAVGVDLVGQLLSSGT